MQAEDMLDLGETSSPHLGDWDKDLSDLKKAGIHETTQRPGIAQLPAQGARSGWR